MGGSSEWLGPGSQTEDARMARNIVEVQAWARRFLARGPRANPPTACPVGGDAAPPNTTRPPLGFGAGGGGEGERMMGRGYGGRDVGWEGGGGRGRGR